MNCMAAPSSPCQAGHRLPGRGATSSASPDRLSSPSLRSRGNHCLHADGRGGGGPLASTSGRGDLNHSAAGRTDERQGEGHLPSGRGGGRRRPFPGERPFPSESPSFSPAFFTTRIRQASSVAELVALCAPHVTEALDKASSEGILGGGPAGDGEGKRHRHVLDRIATAAAVSRYQGWRIEFQ